DEAEATLRRMVRAAPGDKQAWRLLADVQTKQKKFRDSIASLLELVKMDPENAAQTYDELSKRALSSQDDALALEYAERPLSLDRGDAEAQARLGDLYAAQGRTKDAEAAYRAALTKNDRLFPVNLKLAKLLTAQKKEKEALGLLLAVLRGSSEAELVAQAGRM